MVYLGIAWHCIWQIGQRGVVSKVTAHDRRQIVPLPLMIVIAICAIIELTLSLSDLGVIDVPRFRQTVYDYAGFWPGLFYGWTENYPGQSYLMFFSYSILHGGPVHMIFNMITLWSLGSAVIDIFGASRFWLIYIASVLGGSLIYLLWATTTQPMVGASGALFGLAGALLAHNYQERVDLQEELWPIARMGFLLVAINVVMWWALNGQLAWQTHLGGFLTGAAAALWFPHDRSGADTAE